MLPDGFKSVPEDSLLLDPNQLVIDNNEQILLPDQKAVPIDSPEGISNSSATISTFLPTVTFASKR